MFGSRKLFLFFFVVPFSVFAATDGSLGSTSNGSLDISIEIPSSVLVRLISDQNLGTWSGVGAKSSDDDVCVYSNVGSGLYKVSASGNGTGGAFTLSSGANTIPYDVYWNDQVGTVGSLKLTAGATLAGQTGANNSSSNCNSANANYEVKIDETSFYTVLSGTYTGILSLTIEPE